MENIETVFQREVERVAIKLNNEIRAMSDKELFTFADLSFIETSFGAGKEKSFGIKSIDNGMEHTPSAFEYEQLQKNNTFKQLVSKIGGFSRVQRVESGQMNMEFNIKNVQTFLDSEEGQNYRRESGWCLLVGAPTGCLFIPFFWCVDKKNPSKWKSISGFPDEKYMVLCTSKKLHHQFTLIKKNVFKAVAWVPCNADMQQTVENFQETGVYGSVSHVTITK